MLSMGNPYRLGSTLRMRKRRLEEKQRSKR